MIADESAGSNWCALAVQRMQAGDYDAARCYTLAGWARAGVFPLPQLLHSIAGQTAQCYNVASGVLQMELALDVARLAEDRPLEAAIAGDLAALLHRHGQLGRARTLIDWALAHADPHDGAGRGRLLAIAASTAAFQGRLDDALRLLAEARPLVQGLEACQVALTCATVLSYLCQHAGAQQELARAAELLPADAADTAWVLDYVRAWCALVQDDIPTAYALCQETLQRTAKERHPFACYLMLATLGVLARETGDVAGAASRLEQALDGLQARGDQAALLGIHWHQALLAHAGADECTAAARLRGVLQAMHACGYGTTLLWQPRRCAELCAWAISHDVEPHVAGRLLRTSLAAWATQCRRIRRHQDVPAAERLPALTPREQEVLALAAEGLRDREIAARLHLSTRTVQNYLQRCYVKLGAAGRVAAIGRLPQARAVGREERTQNRENPGANQASASGRR